MKITILPLLLLCLFFSSRTFGQITYSVKGSVIDSSSNTRLINTTICVLNAKDSTLRQFVRAGAGGTFTLNKLTKGKFILLISYPDYADYVEHFALDEAKPQHDFGKISLTLKAKLLQEVLIKGTVAAMKIKGDTTEFNAKAYTIQPNSKVEDLLKQLPGIQVDKDGKITAQGETVKKVLVDGEEFFGDDPTLVTKNIRGDMVDKVQLYDKKSDQSAFTGIDDGQKTKTINIKLKEDKKNGYFGKVDAGIGNDGYYSAQAMYNRFSGKKKFSAYGIASNTGKTGLGWEDSNKYGTSNTSVGDDGTIFFSGGDGGDLDSFDGRYNGQGIPIAQTGGIHYDNKWDNDKKTANANYKAGYLEINGSSNNQTQRTLPGSSFNSNTNQDFKNSVFRQKLDYTYTIKLDTTSTLKLSVDGTQKNSKINSNNRSASSSPSFTAGIPDTLLNTNQRTLTNNVNNQIFNASAFYTKKFKKTGRTISVNVAGNMNNSDAKGYLKSEIDFFNKNTALLDSTQKIDQYKTTVTKSHNFNGNATYTEPLNKKTSMVFNYGLGDINSNSDRKSFNNNGGAYNALDTKYSNDYTVNQLSNNFGATLNYRAPNSTLNISARANAVNFKQTDEIAHTDFSRNFLNWNPNASYQYRFTQQKSLRVSYFGSTNQPSIDQIQPVRVNTDPLNIQAGNPLLSPAFNNRFSINYNSYKVISDESIWFSGSYGFTSNAIVNNNTYKNGVNTYQSVNLTGHQPYNFSFNGNYGKKIPGLNINASLFLAGNGNKSYNFSNGVLNTTTSTNYSGQLSFYKSQQKKYDIRIAAGPGYSFGKTSLQPNVNNNGYTFRGYSYFNIYLPGKIQVSSDGSYQYQGKTQTFNDTFSQFLLNASLTKSLLKQETLKLSLSGNDLLDQNKGFTRNSFGGSITQNSYTTIRRYFLFSITWDFNKMGGAPQPNTK